MSESTVNFTTSPGPTDFKIVPLTLETFSHDVTYNEPIKTETNIDWISDFLSQFSSVQEAFDHLPGEASSKETHYETTTPSSSEVDESTPRGIRNNNYLNIQIGPDKWKGKIPKEKNTDGRFEQFETPQLGVRAAKIDITNKIKKGYNTIEKIINKWAPAGDGPNNPIRYAQFVAKTVGIPSTQILDPNDIDTIAKIISAMATMETGVVPDWNIIEEGVRMV